MENQAKLGVVVVMAIGWLATQGCRFSEIDKTHCNYNQGDAYCAEQFPDGEYPFCESGLTGCVSPQKTLGCVAERPSDECYSPCGGVTTIDEDRSCLDESESSSGESSGTGLSSSDGGSSDSETTMGTTGPMPCVGNDDCSDVAAPFCEPVSGECVACDGTDDPDAACAGLDPALPLCVGGTCVQCTAAASEACTGKTPVCDDASNTCVPCTEHVQCGGAACNLFTGACLPADAVVHVGAGQEYATLSAAVMSFAAGAEGTIIVHAGASYDESITVGGGSVLAFLAADLGPMVEPPRWIRSAGTQPQLTVTDATVLMDGMQVSSNASDVPPGVVVDGGRAWMDRSRIIQNAGGGIVAQSAADLVLRNCFVGGDESDVDAVVVDDATASILYATVGGGNGSFGMARALSCTAGSDVTIRNSILAALDDIPELACSMATVSYSASETAIAGTDNVTLGSVQGGWFTNYSTGDFTLAAPPASVTTAAQWQAGDPLVDIDGNARPGIDGLADVAGADVP
jgi:hypothetical protein